MDALFEIAKVGGAPAVLLMIMIIMKSNLQDKITRLEGQLNGFRDVVNTNRDSLIEEVKNQNEAVTIRVNQSFGQNANQYMKIDKNADNICELESKMYNEMVSKSDLPILVKGIMNDK